MRLKFFKNNTKSREKEQESKCQSEIYILISKYVYRIWEIFQIMPSTLLVISAIVFGKTKANEFNITPIHKSSGIYFHTINQLRVFNSHWRFLTYVNITNYNVKYNKIDNIIKEIEVSCALAKSLEISLIQQLCTQYKYQVQSFFSEIIITGNT